MTASTELRRIMTALQEGGLTVEAVEDGALIQDGDARVALFAEPDPQGGVIVRLHLDLDLYVEEDSLSDILMGMNLMNQGLDYGALNLDPVDESEGSEDGEPLTFAVLGRSVLWLPDLGVAELDRLREHLRRFEEEVTQAVERTLHGNKGISA
ncbi:YbjN domain-containing protein [Deinococcus multiflagellatus]|uniref:YbjN domain-containing protein n=1 Tax=Deinococcus multiflagellatus TaxID=1656887 RepID=A0ABW1ZLD1_9DEIO|nr:YbjN domain-containing protein [Deinococcus multiflagellatus]MBZ9713255.1 YbjN domain-containing protein [Deinococcus multiflagellatus]